MKRNLLAKFQLVPEKVIVLALDCVDFDEDRAAHLLDIMVSEEAIQPIKQSVNQR